MFASEAAGTVTAVPYGAQYHDLCWLEAGLWQFLHPAVHGLAHEDVDLGVAGGSTASRIVPFPLRSHCTASHEPLGAILGSAPVRR
jgi:hypothetical protein